MNISRRTVRIGLLALFSLTMTVAFGQPASEMATRSLKNEQHSFLHFIVNTSAVEANIAQRLSRFIKSESDSIQQAILKNKNFSDETKTRGIQSLVYFMESMRENLTMTKTEYYDIPQALETYKLLLSAFLRRQPYDHIITSVNPKRMQLLANTFRGFPEYSRLYDMATYKQILNTPENILRFLENTPGFRFADSLLLYLAAHEPIRISNYLRRYNTELANTIRAKQNPYIQQIVELSNNRNVAEVLPFVSFVAEKQITTEEILQKRLDVKLYFQLLVNTLVESIQNGESSEFLNALRNGIKEKARMFYVDRINELHDAPANVRFAPIKDLRPIDLYYIITSSGEELYTSSYLGIYRKLMEYCKKQSTDSLFAKVNYDNFRTFIRMAANYNTLADFFGCLPEGTTKELMRRYVDGIENDTYTGVEKAMDVADSFSGLVAHPHLDSIIRNELQMNYDRCDAAQQYFGLRMYDILLQVHDVVNSKNADERVKAQLGDYGRLNRKTLENKNGEIVELVLFYGDDDGVASFNNFRSLYRDSSKWESFATDKWIKIRSKTAEPLVIYANLPLDHEEELDLKAQDALSNFLFRQGIEPSILIHRGHSYHLKYTLKRLHPSVKLAILGSCGGYNNILSVANISPDAQIIVSKKIGSKLVNDPMLDLINTTLVDKKDLVWEDVWTRLNDRFKKDAFTLNLFNEYLPPTKNISLFVLKMFNSNEDATRVVTR